MTWEKVRLGDVCLKIGSGSTPKGGANVYIENGVAFIRSQNVYNLRFDYEGLVYINDDTAEKLKGVTVQVDDVLLNITGDSVARTCVVPANLIPARVNQHVSIIRTNKIILNPLFLNYYLASPYMQSFMLGLAVGKGASRNALTKEMISNFVVMCPDINIQNKIVSILSAYDDLIENNQKQIKLLEEAAQRLYKEWFVDLRFPGYETTPIIDGVPEGWKMGKLEEIIIYHDKRRKPLSSLERDTFKGEYRYFGAAGILDYVADYLFDGTYLLFGEDGTVITDQQTPVLQYVTGKFWVNNHAHVLTGKSYYTTEYLYMMFKNMKVSDIVTGVAQPKISQARLSGKKILIPKAKIVIAFQEKVENIFKCILNLEKKNELAKEARDRLIPKLMSGESEV